jgi:hypothetical protein
MQKNVENSSQAAMVGFKKVWQSHFCRTWKQPDWQKLSKQLFETAIL